jgi:hypothetical protein
VTTYRIIHPDPPAALTVRIRRASGEAWQACPLLATAGGWVQVEDGDGPLWVMVDYVNPADRETVGLFNRLNLARS